MTTSLVATSLSCPPLSSVAEVVDDGAEKAGEKEEEEEEEGVWCRFFDPAAVVGVIWVMVSITREIRRMAWSFLVFICFLRVSKRGKTWEANV